MKTSKFTPAEIVRILKVFGLKKEEITYSNFALILILALNIGCRVKR